MNDRQGSDMVALVKDSTALAMLLPCNKTLQYLPVKHRPKVPVKGPKGVPLTLCFISASKSRSVTLTILTFSKPLDDDAPSRPPKDLHRLIRLWPFETHFNDINVCAVIAFRRVLVLEPNKFAVVYPCKTQYLKRSLIFQQRLGDHFAKKVPEGERIVIVVLNADLSKYLSLSSV